MIIYFIYKGSIPLSHSVVNIYTTSLIRKSLNTSTHPPVRLCIFFKVLFAIKFQQYRGGFVHSNKKSNIYLIPIIRFRSRTR